MITRDWYRIVHCPQCTAQHDEILQQLDALQDSDQARRSHFFAGRYENLYLPREAIPALDRILDTALLEAARLLDKNAHKLRVGFWFNIMQQHDATLSHSHDDDDELLSATYYLQAPPDSGKLLLSLPGGVCRIEPVAGSFVFFHPAILHEVETHNASTPRISLGLNIGPARPT